MAFGFGGGLSVDTSFGGGGGQFSGLRDSFERSGVSLGSATPDRFDRDDGSNNGDPGGDSFFARQEKRRNPGYDPSQDSELGDTPSRGDQISAIGRVDGSAIDAFMRGDVASGLDLFARNVGALLGVSEEISQDFVIDETGKERIAFGTRATLDPITLVGNLPFGIGIAGAVAAGKAFGPASGIQVALDALGQREQLNQLGSLAPKIGLGFRPADSITPRAPARRGAGQAPTALDQLAFDYAATRQASIDAAQRQRANRPDRVPDLARSLPGMAPAPARRSPPAAAPSGFGLLAGRDPRTGVDLLRTQEGAAVAAGMAPARPSLVGGRGPRPGSVI